MRIVFIGAVEFSLRALERLVALGAEISGVCTIKVSHFNADHVDLSSFCESHEIPSIYADDINSTETMIWIRNKNPDVIFCFGWSKLIKHDLLKVPPLGIIGFHPAALPANRGRHPLIWALVLGLKKTASTFFFMDEGADSGDILSQEEILITDLDNAGTLYKKVTDAALIQITDFLPQLSAGSFRRIKQNERVANSWRKRSIVDGEIDWRMSAQSIHNLVRGLAAPYVGAHFLDGESAIKVWATKVIVDVADNIEPGKVLKKSSTGTIVKCGKDAIELLITDPYFLREEGSYL